MPHGSGTLAVVPKAETDPTRFDRDSVVVNYPFTVESGPSPEQLSNNNQEIPFVKPQNGEQCTILADIVMLDMRLPYNERHVCDAAFAANVLQQEVDYTAKALDQSSMPAEDRYLYYSHGVSVLGALLVEHGDLLDKEQREAAVSRLKSWQLCAEVEETKSITEKAPHILCQQSIARIVETPSLREQIKKDLVRLRVGETIHGNAPDTDTSPARQADLLFRYTTTLEGKDQVDLKRTCLEFALIGAQSGILAYGEDKTITEAAEKAQLYYLTGRILRDYSTFFEDEPERSRRWMDRAKDYLGTAHTVLSGIHNGPLREDIKKEDALRSKMGRISKKIETDPIVQAIRNEITQTSYGSTAGKMDNLPEPKNNFEEIVNNVINDRADLDKTRERLYELGEMIPQCGSEKQRAELIAEKGKLQDHYDAISLLVKRELIQIEAGEMEQRIGILLEETAEDQASIQAQLNQLSLGSIQYGTEGYRTASALVTLFDTMNNAGHFRNECARDVVNADIQETLGKIGCNRVVSLRAKTLRGRRVRVSAPTLSLQDEQLVKAAA